EVDLLAIVAVAVTLGEDELVPDDDADADARDVVVLQRLGHPGIEVLELGRGVVLGSLRRQTGGNGEEHEKESAHEAAPALRLLSDFLHDPSPLPRSGLPPGLVRAPAVDCGPSPP